MGNRGNDIFWSVLAGSYLSRDRDAGCFTYLFGGIIMIMVIGSIFSFIEEKIIDFFGGSWDEMVIPNAILLIVLTFVILFFDILTVKKRLGNSNVMNTDNNEVTEENLTKIPRKRTQTTGSEKLLSWFKIILYILCIGIGYAIFIGLDIEMFAEALYDKSEETNGTLFPWIFWILLHFISIPIEFILKLIIFPILQFVVVKCIVYLYYNMKTGVV